MNPTYHFAQMRELLNEFEPSRERSLAATKLDECQMWLDRCQPTREAIGRDQTTPTGVTNIVAPAHAPGHAAPGPAAGSAGDYEADGPDGYEPIGEVPY